MVDTNTARGSTCQNSCSLWLYKMLPMKYLISNPKVSLMSYLLVQIVLWAQLCRFQLYSADSVLMMGSKANKNAKMIEELFGPNENPFSLHRATNLGMWLEVIIKPYNKSLLTPEAVLEIHQLDNMLRSMNVSFGRTFNETQDVDEPPFQLHDVCAKQTSKTCSIDGSFILEKEFLRDVSDDDLQTSRSGFYTYPRRGMPSYGPYMFGNKMILSKYGIIKDVNALRFRYNLRGDMSEKPISQIAVRSALWEQAAGEMIKNFQPAHIQVLYGSSTQLKKALVSQNKQGIPYLAAAAFAYFLTLAFAITQISNCKRKYVFSIAAVLLNFTTLLTTFGTLALFHYKPTIPSSLSIIAIVVLGTHQFSILVARFDEMHQRQYAVDNKVLRSDAFRSAFRQCANNVLVSLVFTLVVGISSTVRDIQSSCVIVAVGAIVIALNCFFVYLPLCNIGYRVETLQLNKYNSTYLHQNEGNNLRPESNKHYNDGIVLNINEEFRGTGDTTIQQFESVYKKQQVSSISTYIGLFTLFVIILLLLAALLCTRSNMRSCTDNPGLNKSLSCGLVYANIFRQSNLLLPSILTRISLSRMEKRRRIEKPLSAATSLHLFLRNADSEFTAGAPIQIVYQGDDGPSSDVCPTLPAADVLMTQCKQMLETDKNFELTWFKVFKSAARQQDIAKSLFSKDVVLFEQKKPDNISNEPCTYVKHYRFYCGFRTMRMTLASIRTMHALNHIANNATNSIRPLRTGRFSTFSLAYFLLELVEGTNRSLMIATIVYLFCAIVPCLIHEMINFRRNACLTKMVNSPSLSNRRRSITSYQFNLRWMWNLTAYALETAEIFLLSYVYVCLFAIQIDFINGGLILIGFLLMPLCLSGNMLIEVTENSRLMMLSTSAAAEAQNMTPRLEMTQEEENCFLTVSETKKSVRRRVFRKRRFHFAIPFSHTIISPLLVSTLPLIWFALMLPFTESPLLRIFEHVCLYTCVHAVFAGIFVYISLQRFLVRK